VIGDGGRGCSTRAACVARAAAQRRGACLGCASVPFVLRNRRPLPQQHHHSESDAGWAFVAVTPSRRSTVCALCPHLPLDPLTCASFALSVGAYGLPSLRTRSQHGTRVLFMPGFRHTAVAVRVTRSNSVQRVRFAEAHCRPQWRCGWAACVGNTVGDTPIRTTWRRGPSVPRPSRSGRTSAQ